MGGAEKENVEKGGNRQMCHFLSVAAAAADVVCGFSRDTLIYSSLLLLRRPTASDAVSCGGGIRKTFEPHAAAPLPWYV